MSEIALDDFMVVLTSVPVVSFYLGFGPLCDREKKKKDSLIECMDARVVIKKLKNKRQHSVLFAYL